MEWDTMAQLLLVRLKIGLLVRLKLGKKRCEDEYSLEKVPGVRETLIKKRKRYVIKNVLVRSGVRGMFFA